MKLLDLAGGLVDRGMVRLQTVRAGRSATVDAMDHAQRLQRLADIRPTYDRPEHLAFPGYLAPGPAIEPTATDIARDRFGRVLDLSWDSAYAPWSAEVAETYTASPENATVHARLFDVGDGTGPAIVVIHGYGAGHFALEQYLWPTGAWRRRGVAVAMIALPYHGRRGAPGRRLAPPFPAADPRLTHEGFRQAVHDVTALIGWLRARGHAPVSLVGMSLGGYTAALLATLIDELDAVGLVIPLASLADYARAQGRLGEGDVADRLHAELEATYRAVSPVARPPKIAPDRVGIVAARGDRITGLPHAERLGAHFGTDPIVCSGSHTLQLGLRDALDRWLARSWR